MHVVEVPPDRLERAPSPFSIVGPEIAPTQPLGVWPTPVIVTGTDALLWICTVTT
jgi:hypothetical protein